MAKIIPNRVFEDYEPPSDLVTEEGCDTLLIYLPGFKKEQLKVQLTTSRMLKISGERPIAENKYRRFHKEFRVPSNCDTKDISAKFEGGILYIRQPKVITPVAPQDKRNAPTPPAVALQDKGNAPPPTVAAVPPQAPTVATPPQLQGHQPQQGPAQSQPQQEAPNPQPQEPQTHLQSRPANQISEKEPPVKGKEEGVKEDDATMKNEKHEMGSKDNEKKDVCSLQPRPAQGVSGGLFRELRKPDNLKSLAVSVLMVLIIGFYISYMFKSFVGNEQGSSLDCNGEL